MASLLRDDFVTSNDLVILHLDSMNGTFVDGQEISGKVEIHEGSEIILADRRYIARWED